MFNEQAPKNVYLTALMVLSWLGMMIHNRIELPDIPFVRLEVLLPTLLSLALLAAWWLLPDSQPLLTWLILLWSAIQFIIGGVLSVLPLPIWPFVPEQTFGHYFTHLIYSLAQVPILLFLVLRLLRQPNQRSSNG